MNRGFIGTSLTYRFALWFIVVALQPLILLGYLGLRQNEAALHSDAIDRLARLADKKTLEIKNYLHEREQNARLLARGKLVEQAIPGLSDAYLRHGSDSADYLRTARQFDRYFANYIDGRVLFYDVFLITPQGEIIYTNRHESDFTTNLLNGPYRDSQLAHVFRESRMTLESNISDFEFYAPSSEPAAFVAAPIIRDGAFKGVLAFQLNTERIYQVAKDSVGLGVTGETALAKSIDSEQAVFVAPLDSDPQAAFHRKINLITTTLPMRHALMGERGNGIGFDYRGRQVVAAWRYLPELNWGIVVKMDTDEVFAPLHQQQKNLLEVLLALMLFAGVVAFYFGRRLVVPLRSFALTANEIAKGDLSKRVEESRLDEIGALGRAFNRMTENLQVLYRTLEDRVEERTRELNVSNEQLQEEIAEREHIESELKNSKSQYDRLTTNIPIGVYLLRTTAGGGFFFEFVSARFCAMLDLTAESVYADSGVAFHAIHPDDLADFIKLNQTVVQARKPFLWEGRSLVNGVTKWLRIESQPEPLDNGDCIWDGMVTDITDRKKAEEQMRVAAAAFETHDAILITDANANIIRVNRAFQDITGYSSEDVLGKNPRILSSGRQDKAFYAAMWQQLLSTGSWTGEIWDRRKSGQIYPKWLNITAVRNEQGITTEYVAIFNDITARKQAEEEIRNLAFYDALTKLPNRRLLLDRFRLALSVSARSNHYGALLFLDMDKFKTLNDTLGHDHGDLLLIEVAQRIQLCVREVDTVARLGGDEFVVLIEEISSSAEDASQKTALIAEKIRASLSAPYQLKDYEYHTSPSIGVCLYHGNDESVDTLLKHADMAMYQAKESGRNAVRFFDPAMQLAVETRAAIEADLRHAIPDKQLHVFYQIQLDNDHRPLGAEALVRWVHPKRGMVSPAQFIPIAEESSLILDYRALGAANRLPAACNVEQARENTLPGACRQRQRATIPLALICGHYCVNGPHP